MILEAKGSEVWTVEPDDSVFNAIKLMAEKHIGAVVVLSGKKLVGVLSERDYLRKVILQGRASKDTAVREIMTSRVVTVDENHTLESCMALMNTNGFRHLPVIDKRQQVIGMLSMRDVLGALVVARGDEIQLLEAYILGH
jgi:CBS domain-containing protein